MTIQITRDNASKVLEVVDAGLCKGLGNPVPGKMCVEAAVCYALGLPHGDDPSCVAPALRSLKIKLNDKSWSSNAARAKGLRRLAVAQLGSAGHLDEKEFVKRIATHAISVSVPLALRSAASIHKNAEHRAALIEAAVRCEKEQTKQAALDARNTAADAADAAADAYAAYAADAADAYAAYAAAAAAADAYAAAAAAADAAADAYAAYADAYAAAAADAYAAYAAAAAAADAADAYAADAAAAADAYAADAADAAAAAARDKVLSDYAEAIVQILIEMKAPGCQWLDLCEVAA